MQPIDRFVALGIVAQKIVDDRQLLDALIEAERSDGRGLVDCLLDRDLLSARKCVHLGFEIVAGLMEQSPDANSAVERWITRAVDAIDWTATLPELAHRLRLEPVTAERRSRWAATRWTPLDECGHGGLGVVWRAYDEALQRNVALKEIRPEYSGESHWRSRFLREAEITAQLQHPNIVPVYQVGRDGSGGPFYVMKLVNGRDFGSLIADAHDAGLSRSDLRRLLDIFIDVCHAVAFAHSKGVVHRDLKPANVMSGDFGETLVLDWGLARLDADRASHDHESVFLTNESREEATEPGVALGSPSYMAPEQAAGRNGEVNERTDVFGLGGILFAILTGRSPHGPKGDRNLRVMLDGISRWPVPPPNVYRADVPHGLNAICAKALSLRSEDRYASAAAMADEVRRWLAGETVAAFSEPWYASLARWSNRHARLSQFIGVLLILAFGAFLSIAVYTAGEARHAVEKELQRMHDVVGQLEVNVRTTNAEHTNFGSFVGRLPSIVEYVQARRSTSADPALRDRMLHTLREVVNVHRSYVEAMAVVPIEPGNPSSDLLALRIVRTGLEPTSYETMETRFARNNATIGFIRAAIDSKTQTFAPLRDSRLDGVVAPTARKIAYFASPIIGDKLDAGAGAVAFGFGFMVSVPLTARFMESVPGDYRLYMADSTGACFYMPQEESGQGTNLATRFPQLSAFIGDPLAVHKSIVSDRPDGEIVCAARVRIGAPESERSYLIVLVGSNRLLIDKSREARLAVSIVVLLIAFLLILLFHVGVKVVIHAAMNKL